MDKLSLKKKIKDAKNKIDDLSNTLNNHKCTIEELVNILYSIPDGTFDNYNYNGILKEISEELEYRWWE